MVQIEKHLATGCAIVAEIGASRMVISNMLTLSKIFENDPFVLIGKFDQIDLTWSNDDSLKYQVKENNIPDKSALITIFMKDSRDRTCLIPAPYQPPLAEYLNGHQEIQVLVDVVNHKCQVFRNLNGSLNHIGIQRMNVLQNLYHPVKGHNSSMTQLPNPTGLHTLKSEKANDTNPSDETCETIEMPSMKTDFLTSFLLRSKPVIIKNAINTWPAMTKWSNEYFLKKVGNKRVHIKLTEDGEFEGCEPVSEWNPSQDFKIPDIVRKQLQFDDLVVVRPATVDIPFADFLNFVKGVNDTHKFSAYLEYTSIKEYMSEIIKDVHEMPFIRQILELKELNIWLSDGNTLGKLHFDPYDNFLCQLSGKKRLTLFDPHDNERMYEGHIPEAKLEYDWDKKIFKRRKLLTSTSMVMSPINILKPDLKRFPKFAKATPVICEISPGDVLFMPAFWWHEVQSYPDIKEKRNLAVNFWYKPFLTKEFPCSTCKLDINPDYYHLLDSMNSVP